MEQPQFPGVMRAILADQGGLEHFERARSIDHAGEPRDEHVEDRADAREHEHRAERELDRLGDRGDGGEHFHDVAHDASKRAGCNPARIAGVSIMIDYLTDPDRGVVEFTVRSEEHTSELQSLMRTSYAV